MANVFIDLPVPAAVGVGATVDTSSLGADRTVTMAGSGYTSANIEVSQNGTDWTQLTSFSAVGGTRTIRFASALMRVRVVRQLTPLQPVVANCDVAADDSGTNVITLVVPTTSGFGAAVDVSALEIVKSAIVLGTGVYGTFRGSVVIQASADGIDYVDQYNFGPPGGLQTREFTAQFVRVKRAVGSNPGTATCQIGGALPAGGVGAGGPIPPNPTIDEPEFTDGPTSLATGPTIISGAQIPNTGPGVFAPTGTLYLHRDPATDIGRLFQKLNSEADTEWEELSWSEAFNVVDYGADGIPVGGVDDGSVNDTAAFQAAFQAAQAAGGGTVYYPSNRDYILRDRPGIGASAALPPATVNNLGSAANITGDAINVQFKGDGNGAGRVIQRGNSGGGDWSMFDVLGDANFLRWTDLRLDGDERKGSWPFNQVDEHPNFWTETDPSATLEPVSTQPVIHGGTTGQIGVNGVGDSITAGAPATITDAAGLFNEGMTANGFILISGAPTAANNGVFPVVGFVDANNLEYTNAAAFSEAAPAAVWSIIQFEGGRVVFNDPSGTFRAGDLNRFLITKAGNARDFNRGSFQIGEVLDAFNVVIRNSGFSDDPSDCSFSAGPVQTLTSPSSSFDSSWIGAVVFISGSAVNVANRGQFVVTGATATTLTYTNAAAVAEGPLQATIAIAPEEPGPMTYDVVDDEDGYVALNGTRAAAQTFPTDVGRYVPAELGPERQTQRLRYATDKALRMGMRSLLSASAAGAMAFGVAMIAEDDTEWVALEYDGATFRIFGVDANGAFVNDGFTAAVAGQTEWLMSQTFGVTPGGTTPGAVTSITAAGVTLNSADGLFTAAMVGARVRIADATNDANNGVFPVTGFTDANNITYSNPSAVDEGAGASYQVEGGTSSMEFRYGVNLTLLATETDVLFSPSKTFVPILYQRALSAALTGTGDTIAGGAPATLTDAAGLFVAGLVGAKIRIAGATNPDNNGLFPIVGFTGPTIITYDNPSAVGVTEAFTWEIVEAADVERMFYLDSGVFNKDAAEQNHIIQLRHRSTSRTLNDFDVFRCRIEQSIGDAVRMTGATGLLQTRRVRVRNNVFVDCGRAALSVQRECFEWDFTNNYCSGGTDQQLDFEPTGSTQGPSQWIVAQNIFDNRRQSSRGQLVTLGGVSTFTRAEYGFFLDNLMLYGNLFSLDLGRVQIRGNTLISNISSPQPPFNFSGALVELTIQDNIMRAVNPEPGNVISMSTRNDADPTRISILNNRLYNRYEGAPVNIENPEGVEVRGNFVEYGGEGQATNLAITYRLITARKFGRYCQVDGNTFRGIFSTGTSYAMRLSTTDAAAGGGFPGFAFRNNAGSRWNYALLLSDANFNISQPILASGNAALDLITGFVAGIDNVGDRLAIAGNSGLGALSVLQGEDDPVASSVPAVAGDVYLRDNGAAPFYNADGTVAGWRQIATRNAGQTFEGQQLASETTLTDAAGVALDASANNIFDLLATGAVGATRAINAPSNIALNQQFLIRFKQDGTGGRALTFNAVFDFGDAGAPDFTTDGANETGIVSCHVVQTGPTIIAATLAVQGLATT